MKVRLARRLCCLLLVLGGLTACQPRPEPALLPPPTVTAAPVTLRLGVADSAATLAALTTAPYAAQAPWVRLQFVPASTETLFADLAAGELSAILVHYLPPGVDVWFNPVALDGLVIIVPPTSPVNALTQAEVQALFSGRLTDWRAVGGPAGAVNLVTRERGAGTRAIFRQRLLADQPLAITARVEATAAGMLAAVAADPAAIGYAMLSQMGDNHALVIDGVAPSLATVTDQSYPLTAPLYFVTLVEPQGEARAFLAWLQSDAGQTVLSERFGRVR